ncbi:hypothetical protein D3C81_1570430 [compost metagenome]
MQAVGHGQALGRQAHGRMQARQQDHAAAEAVFSRHAQEFDAVDVGHGQVADQQVGLVLLQGRQRLFAVRLAADVERAHLLEHVAEHVEHENVVVQQQHAQRRQACFIVFPACLVWCSVHRHVFLLICIAVDADTLP